MTQQDEIREISKLISSWLSNIRTDAVFGLQDINKHSEDLACDILNVIYDLELKNLNLTIRPNYYAIDLGDEKNGIAYQVTASNSSSEIIRKLKLFVKQKEHLKYKKGIRFLILNPVPIKHGNKDYKTVLPGFSKREHIITEQNLIKSIRKLYQENRNKFDKIKSILIKQYPLTGYQSEKDSPISLLPHDEQPGLKEKINLLKEQKEYERDIYNYFADLSKVQKDYITETIKVFDEIKAFSFDLSDIKVFQSRFEYPNNYITLIEHDSQLAFHAKWQPHYSIEESIKFDIEIGIFKAENYDQKVFPNNNILLIPISSSKYNFHFDKSKKKGWLRENKEDDFNTSKELVDVWKNQYLNHLLYK